MCTGSVGPWVLCYGNFTIESYTLQFILNMPLRMIFLCRKLIGVLKCSRVARRITYIDLNGLSIIWDFFHSCFFLIFFLWLLKFRLLIDFYKISQSQAPLIFWPNGCSFRGETGTLLYKFRAHLTHWLNVRTALECGAAHFEILWWLFKMLLKEYWPHPWTPTFL